MLRCDLRARAYSSGTALGWPAASSIVFALLDYRAQVELMQLLAEDVAPHV